MRKRHHAWLWGFMALSLLLAVPALGHVPAIAAITPDPTPIPSVPAAPAEATPAIQPDSEDALLPLPRDLLELDYPQLLPPFDTWSQQPGLEALSAAQSDPPYRAYLFSIGAQAAVEHFNDPYGIAVAPDGSVYVADTENHRIQYFGATGVFQYAWGSQGSGDGQFNFPGGIAVAADGTVYVADTNNHRIQHFSSTGNYLGQWGTLGNGDGQLSYPRAVAVAPLGMVYVADSANNRIQYFSALGNYLGQWGGYGSGDGQFNYPRGVAVAPNGNVYVSDTNNNRIQRFGVLGNYLTQWGSAGTGNEQFDHPYGVTVATNGTVYVVDRWNYRVQHFGASGIYLGQWQSYATPFDIAVAPDGTVYVAVFYGVQYYTTSGSYLGGWGTYSSEDGQLRYPVGVAVAADGTVYVADEDNNRIQRFSANGTYIRKWGTYGDGDGQFFLPRSIAVAADGTFYVADSGNNRIQRFSTTGGYLGQWGEQGAGNGQFDFPSGVAVAPDGTVYVVDTYNHRIQRFNDAGTYLGKWGTYGIGDRQFDSPNGVAVSPDGSTVYVADTYNHRIQRFSFSGGYLTQWGGEGYDDGEFYYPMGVTVAADGTVYVADSGNYRIQHFSANGTYLGQWGTRGTGDGQFSWPGDVAVAFDGTVYVADSGNYRIQAFGLVYPTFWRGEYFGNRWLAERPLYIRSTPGIDFTWGAGSPDPVIPVEEFSSRWKRFVNIERTGLYRFTVSIDDGVRLWVDDRLILEAWQHPQIATFTPVLQLDAGYHNVRMEHYDFQGSATAQLAIEYVDTTAPESSATAPDFTNATPVAVAWTAADDYAGVSHTELWLKIGNAGTWSGTGMVQSGNAGAFTYNFSSGNERYYFATVAMDNAGNTEAAPIGGGDTHTVFDTVIPSSNASSPPYANAAIPVSWTANDNLAGVASTRLWVKTWSGGAWFSTAMTQSGTSGTFTYVPIGSGTHYFATVATDKASNKEAAPSGDGDTHTLYDVVAPESSSSSPTYARTTLVVSWTASDNAAGVANTRLWTKLGSGGTWASTNLVQNGTSGTFYYTPPTGDGTYYVATVATDNAGNVEASPSGDGDASTVLDNTPPVSDASSPTYTNGDIGISWTASDAPAGVASTRLWTKFGSDGTWTSTPMTQIGTSGIFTYTPTSGDGRYYFATVAKDNVGNLEATPLSGGDTNTVFDTLAPVSSASSPAYANGAIPISWTANDARSGIASTRLWVKTWSGGTWFATNQTQSGTSGTFNYIPSSGGTYYFATAATDGAGNLEAPPAGDGDSSTLYDNVAPVSSASSPDYAKTTIVVSWDASDNASGVANTRLWIKKGSAGTWTSTSLTQNGTAGTFYYTPPAGDGVYYVATVATDNAGNVETGPLGSGDATTVVDNTAPVSDAGSPAYANDDIAVSWVASDATSDVVFTRLWVKFGSGGTWTSTPLTQTGTSGTFNYDPTRADGRYFFATVAKDSAGNMEAFPEGTGDTNTLLDRVKPESHVTVPPVNPMDETVQLPWIASDANSGIATVKLWVKIGETGSWTATGLSQSGTSGTFDYTFGENANYYFATVATDSAGNREDLPAGTGDGSTVHSIYFVLLPLTFNDYICPFYGPWELEPNNNYLEANGPIISGRAYYGYPDEKDYFSFYMLEHGDITIDLTNHMGEGVQLQLFYEVVKYGDHVAEVRPPGPYHIEYHGDPGWYYVYIYSSGGYIDTSFYTLRVTYPQ